MCPSLGFGMSFRWNFVRLDHLRKHERDHNQQGQYHAFWREYAMRGRKTIDRRTCNKQLYFKVPGLPLPKLVLCMSLWLYHWLQASFTHISKPIRGSCWVFNLGAFAVAVWAAFRLTFCLLARITCTILIWLIYVMYCWFEHLCSFCTSQFISSRCSRPCAASMDTLNQNRQKLWT